MEEGQRTLVNNVGRIENNHFNDTTSSQHEISKSKRVDDVWAQGLPGDRDDRPGGPLRPVSDRHRHLRHRAQG